MGILGWILGGAAALVLRFWLARLWDRAHCWTCGARNGKPHLKGCRLYKEAA